MSTVIPEKVYHKEYGYGEVVRVVSSKIYVLFGSVQRIFDYPEAFDKGYLRTAKEIDSSKKPPAVSVVEPVLNERKELTRKVESQSLEIAKMEKELAQMRIDNEFLRVAHTVPDNPEAVGQFKKQVAKMVRDIDRCIKQLNA